MEIDEESIHSVLTATSSMNGSAAPSVYSYSSSRDGRMLLRELGGRTLNAQNELYLLPADEDEHLRLDKQHLVHLLSVGRNFIGAEEVEEALAPLPGVQRAILDLGCGGGNWATSMAQEFPHAQVVGVDLAPSTTRPPPTNCRFEFDDFTLGLEHYYKSFDVVHLRAVANGVKDYKWLINETAKCLKFGGVLIYVEGNFELMNENRQPQELAFGDGAPGQSWTARMMFEAYNALKSRGSLVDAGILLERWMNECPDLGHVKYDERWIPIGPWESGTDPEDTRIKGLLGTLMRQNIKEFARSLQPVFVANGYPPEMIERFAAGVDKELNELSVHTYLRYHHCWARRVTIPEDDPEDAERDARRADIDMAVPGTPPTAPSGMSSRPGSASPGPPPGPRSMLVQWLTNPETGERFLDTESFLGSLRSMGSASMSMSSGPG